MKKFLFKRDTFFATVFVFLVIYLLELITVNMEIFNPFVHSFRDFELTDLYYSKLKTKTSLDTNIILVNAENLTRMEIAKKLAILNSYHPKVIGVDLLFRDKKDEHGDSSLMLALHENKNTVLPYSAGCLKANARPCYTRINSLFGKLYSGFIDICGDSASTVREFYPFWKFRNGEDTSFDAKILALYDLTAFQNLKKRNRLKERINYFGNTNRYLHFNPGDITLENEQLSILKNKIVLIGYFGYSDNGQYCNCEDRHFTPMNPKISGRSFPDMNGVTIHANIISMTLNKNYINAMPYWLNFILAFILCYINIAFLIYMFTSRIKWYHFFGIIVQFIASIIILLFVFYVYQLFNYRIESTLAMVAIILSVEVLYFYNGLAVWLNKRFNFKTEMKH